MRLLVFSTHTCSIGQRPSQAKSRRQSTWKPRRRMFPSTYHLTFPTAVWSLLHRRASYSCGPFLKASFLIKHPLSAWWIGMQYSFRYGMVMVLCTSEQSINCCVLDSWTLSRFNPSDCQLKNTHEPYKPQILSAVPREFFRHRTDIFQQAINPFLTYHILPD